ncbi:MAG: DUF58 domain-containing protein [Oscillospiraceae bacterium]
MKTLKTFVSYVTILIIIGFYTFFLDGKSGMIMAAFFIIVPIVSFILTVMARKSISITLVCDEKNIEKNRDFKYSINISKRNFLPVPFVTLKILTTPHIISEDENTICFSMPVKKEMSVESICRTRYSGNAEILIESAYITDYLNIFSMKLPNVKAEHKIEIIPEIHELDTFGGIFRAAADTICIDENEEETDTASVFGMSAFAGYEHREYAAGDPIKRINWKLSANKGKLMIRLDEKMPAARPEIVLNLSGYNDNTESCIEMRERIMEGCLSFAYFCVRNGIECNISYSENNSWKSMKIGSADDIKSLALKLSSFSDMDNSTALPENALLSGKSSGTFMLFTPDYTEMVRECADTARQQGNSVFVVCGDNEACGDDLWHISDTLEISERRAE